MNSQEQPACASRAAGRCGSWLLPLRACSGFGNAWVRIADMALLFVLLALGLNIVVGYAGLLDLGYVAFFAIGAYMYGLLDSPHLTETFASAGRHVPDGLHTPIWLVMPLAAGLAGVFGVLLGAPTLRAARRLSGHRDAGLWRDHPACS
jgi:branched-chain amino acid transport system permease protein